MNAELTPVATMAGIDPLTALAQARALLAAWTGQPLPGATLVGADRAMKVFALTEEEVATATAVPWFILGDLHGDIFALASLLSHLESLYADFGLISLGDLLDRGPHPAECVALLLDLAARRPGRVIWIAGNHDEGLRFDAAQQRFVSSVHPAEFAEQLNQSGDVWLGQALQSLVASLPRALLWPDGVLLTHGGMPHTDLQKQLPEGASEEEVIRWLNLEASLRDFTWTRICRYKMKFPNRTSSGSQYGYEDFAGFCSRTVPHFPVRALVTGHEHPEGGVDEHASWIVHPALTLSGFAFGDSFNPATYLDDYLPAIPFAQLKQNERPAVYLLSVDRMALTRFYEAEIQTLLDGAGEPPADKAAEGNYGSSFESKSS
jgi:hypothetical protein